MPSHDLWIMQYEYEQPHWVTKTITDAATAKHSNPSAAAKFLFFWFLTYCCRECPSAITFFVGFPLSVITLVLICSGGCLVGCIWKIVGLGLTVCPHRHCVGTGCVNAQEKESGGGGVDWHSQLNNWVNLRWWRFLSPQLIAGSSLFTAQLFSHTSLRPSLFLPFFSSILNPRLAPRKCQCICMYVCMHINACTHASSFMQQMYLFYVTYCPCLNLVRDVMLLS